MLLIATHNPDRDAQSRLRRTGPDCDGSVMADGRALIEKAKMSRFILRATVSTAPADCSVGLTGFHLRGGYRQPLGQMVRFATPCRNCE